MNQLKTTINRMPVRIWNRIRANDAGLVLRKPEGGFPDDGMELRASEQIRITQDFGGLTLDAALTGPFVSAGLAEFIDRTANLRRVIRIPENHTEREPIVLAMRLDANNPALTDDVVIEAGEGSEATVILTYASEPGVKAEHCGRTRVIVGPNASVKLVKAQMLQNEAAHTDAIGGVVRENGRLTVIAAELGAASQLSGGNLILDGEGGEAGFQVVYLGDGERSLDMTYRIEHRGRKTVSHIGAKGILLEKSRKVFRDTLDFLSGASGSKGREEESVLMLGPDVRNVSVPLLLCTEDDVEGEHAASSGRPDDRILFYLMSRGVSEREAKKLLAQAAVSSIVEQIPDGSVRKAILETVRGSIERGG